MIVDMHQARDDGPFRARISGTMTLADQHALEAAARRAIDGGGTAALLVVLEQFHGWAADEGWAEDLAFQAAYGARVAAIAIVGPAQWEEACLMYVGKGFRGTQIAFFAPDALQEAEAWLETQLLDRQAPRA